MVINYLPVGSEQATKWYVEHILNARCAMVNCIPVFLAREEYWRKPVSRSAGFPSSAMTSSPQLGATITHRVLTRLFEDRGVTLDNTYQLNFGGQYRLPQHAGERAPDVQEDFQDLGGHFSAGRGNGP